jgi:branched-chain amino acid transport system substrate-binding protein
MGTVNIVTSQFTAIRDQHSYMTRDRVSRRTVLKGSAGAVALTGLAGCIGGGGNNDGGNGGGGGSNGSGGGDGSGNNGGNGGGGGSSNGGTTKSGGASGTVKIGVLQPLSGPLVYYGKQSIWGFYSGLAHKAGTKPIPNAQTGMETVEAGDVTYELYIRDSKLSAQTAQQLATDLVQNQQVDILFGPTSSGAAERLINNVVKPAGVPLMVGPAASSRITSKSELCHELVFRANENTAMDARSGGQYIASETDVKTVYLFGADYSFGHAVVENYGRVLRNRGIEIVGTKFVPQGYSEWKGLLDNAKQAGADAIVAGFTSATLPQIITTLLQGSYEFQLIGGWATKISVNVIGKTLQKVLGKPLTKEKLSGSNISAFTTRYHWNQYDNPINKKFTDTYTSTYGIVPDLFTSGTFTAASSIFQAVEESGSTSGADIANALTGMTVSETPKGKDAYVFQKYNNQAKSPMTIAPPIPTSEAKWPAPIMPGKPIVTIDKDKTTIPPDSSQMDCSL